MMYYKCSNFITKTLLFMAVTPLALVQKEIYTSRIFCYAANPFGALSPFFHSKCGFSSQYLLILTKRALISRRAGSRIFMTIPQNKVNMHINIYAKFHPQYCPSDYPINT